MNLESRIPNLVSTIIPVFNGEATIGPAIESALIQDYPNQEIIVVDDGSTDGTSRVVQSFGTRIRIITQPNCGLSAARNAGWRISGGEFLAWLDADDIWLPGKLQKCICALDCNPDAVLAFSAYFDLQGEVCSYVAGRAPSLEELLHIHPVSPPSGTVMRRWAFERCGGFSEDFRGMGCEDLDLYLRMRELGRFEYLSESLLLYNHPDQRTKADKYLPGRRPFLLLIKQRYHKRSAALLKRALDHNFGAAFFLQAMLKLEEGDRLGALRSLCLSVRFWPLYLFTGSRPHRVFRRANIERLKRLFVPSRQS